MSGLFRFFMSLGLGALLAGCCANTNCDCQDERADAFYFRFATSGADSFDAKTELDTVLVKRFALQLDAKGQPVLIKTKLATFEDYADSLNAAGSFDLVTVVRATAARHDTIVVSNNFPFAQSSARRLNAYLYRIEVRSAPYAPKQYLKINPLRYEVKSIKLEGRFVGDGCCTCYRNTLKTASLVKLPAVVGQPVPAFTAITATETDKVPVYTTITK